MKLVKDLEAYGFQINPYDPYLEKNMINNKHMVVVWHMYVLKVSYIDIFEITNFSGYMYNIYGGLTVHRVNVHEYLGMDYN